MTVWAYSLNEQLTVPKQDTVGGGDGGSEGVWGELWRCALALPAVHLSFSPDGAMFATASKDDHFVKIWYLSKIGVCECVCECVCVCVHVHVRACVYACTCMCAYVCVRVEHGRVCECCT